MATAADYGFQTPTGSDLISGGDDAISFNAERAAYWLDRVRYIRETVPSTDLDTITEAGIYCLGVPFPDGYLHAPAGASGPSLLNVGTGPPYNWGFQTLYQIGSTPKFWWRTSTTTTSWGEWHVVPTMANSFGQKRLDPSNLDTMLTPGVWSLPAPYPSGYSGVPAGNDTASMFVVYSVPGQSWGAQEIFQYGSTQRRWWRVTRSAFDQTWNDWVEVKAGGGSDPIDAPVNALATGSRDMRLQLFRQAYPLVSTGGKGAVVFRYDHGLTNVKSTLLPIHQQHNVPLYIAMNSRNWGVAENSGATQDDARAWSATGLVEWGNHTATHDDSTGIADIHDNIVNGRIELESQLNTTIHGFTVPGVTEFDKFDGFGTGFVSGYSNSYAGSLILAHHAITSGVIGPLQRPLDGTIKIGTRHTGWETADVATIKGLIDDAAAGGTALTLMAHPRTLGMDGRWNESTVQEIVGYVRQLIDSGDLADISYYQSHHATTAPLS